MNHTITVKDAVKTGFYDWECSCGLALYSIDAEDVQDCTRVHQERENFQPEALDHQTVIRGGLVPGRREIFCSCGWNGSAYADLHGEVPRRVAAEHEATARKTTVWEDKYRR